jgi:hypothetical protein
MKNYGGFTVEIFPVDNQNDLEKIESLLLKQYCDDHLELPPINLSSYKLKHIKDNLKNDK